MTRPVLPQTALPSTNIALVEAAEHRTLPNKEIAMLIKKIHFKLNILYNFPNMNWKEHLQRR